METSKLKNASAWAFGSLIILLIFVVGYFLPYIFSGPAARVVSWLIVMLLMIGFVGVLGLRISGRLSGVFINERYKMTLSRFQLVIWTIIVLSAFVTIALERTQAGTTDPLTGALNPLAIALPPQLWALLGISTANLAGSPLVLSTKVSRKPTGDAFQLAAEAAAARADVSSDVKVKGAQDEYDKAVKDFKWSSAEATNAKDKLQKETETARKSLVTGIRTNIENSAEVYGSLDSNKDPSEAKFSEMFTGDEVGNKNVIDMAKVQMFFFTLLMAFSYAISLMQLIMTQTPATMNSFPELTDGVVALLGISSGGYLASKTVDHTKTVPK